MGFRNILLAAAACLAVLSTGCATGNRVLNLNGRSEFGHLGDQPVLRLAQGDFSISAWIQVASFGDNNNALLSKRGNGNNNGWTFYIAGKTWPVLSQKVMFHASQGDNPFTVSKSTLSSGEWYHVSAVYYSAQRKMVIYIDGNEDAVGENMTQPNPLTNVSLYLGRDSVFPRYFFNGMMDDVAIWQKALTTAEVKQVMASDLKGGEPGLLALWNFDQGDLSDQSGNGFVGELIDHETGTAGP